METTAFCTGVSSCVARAVHTAFAFSLLDAPSCACVHLSHTHFCTSGLLILRLISSLILPTEVPARSAMYLRAFSAISWPPFFHAFLPASLAAPEPSRSS